jgi:HAD superfamily hydrolase (TIGR01509 family)
MGKETAKGLRALIFDVDGTLAETEEAHRAAFNRAFAAFGLPWVWDRALYRVLLRVAGGKERIGAFIGGHDPERAAGGNLDTLIGALHRHKTALYTHAVAAGTVAYRPGIVALVEEAHGAGLPLAIATTTSRANVDALLAGAPGALDPGWFAAIKCAEDAPRKKPDPQVYQAALKALGIPAAQALAIEDSRNGVLAAGACGVPVLVTESVYTAGDGFPEAVAVLPDLGGLRLADLRRLHRSAKVGRAAG